MCNLYFTVCSLYKKTVTAKCESMHKKSLTSLSENFLSKANIWRVLPKCSYSRRWTNWKESTRKRLTNLKMSPLNSQNFQLPTSLRKWTKSLVSMRVFPLTTVISNISCFMKIKDKHLYSCIIDWKSPFQSIITLLLTKFKRSSSQSWPNFLDTPCLSILIIREVLFPTPLAPLDKVSPISSSHMFRLSNRWGFDL